jgi:hypothetical protein
MRCTYKEYCQHNKIGKCNIAHIHDCDYAFSEAEVKIETMRKVRGNDDQGDIDAVHLQQVREKRT